MRDDLLHAQGTIDWTVAQFPSFHSRVNSWLKANVRVETIQPDPTSREKLIVVVQKEALPLAFSVEAGVYVGTIRSSLDILASALNERFSVTGHNNVYFPVADS